MTSNNHIIDSIIKESAAVGVSTKKLYNYTIKKFKNDIEKDLKEIKKVFRKNKVKGTAEISSVPDYSEFKNWYEWGGSGGNFYIEFVINKKLDDFLKEEGLEENLKNDIHNVIEKSKYPEAYFGYSSFFGIGDKTKTSISFILDDVKDFDIYKIQDEIASEKDKVIEKKEQKALEKKLKNYSKAKAIQLATEELVNIHSVKPATKGDIEIIAQKYGINDDELRKSFDEYQRKKQIEESAKDLYNWLIGKSINPNLNKEGYERYKNMIVKNYSFDNRETKELEKYFNKNFKFKDVDKEKLFDTLSYSIDKHFRVKMKKPLEARLKLKGQMKKLVEDYAKREGVDAKELIKYYQDIYLHEQRDDAKRIEKFKDNLIKTTLGRLPRFIHKVVKNVPVLLMSKRGGKGTNSIASWDRSKKRIHLYLKKHLNFKNALESMAHEYWHAFEDLSGFQFQAKKEFNKVVEDAKMGDMAKNAMEDFIKVTNLVYQYTRDPLYKKELDNFKRAWLAGDKNYFKIRSGYLWDNVKKNVEKRDFYESLSEVLADTCGYIASGESGKALSQSLVVWMNKKFSSNDGMNKNSYFEVLEDINKKFE